MHCRAEQHLSVAKGRGRRRASAAVEFAVIVPFLTLLALGMIEVTRAIQVKDALTDAARSGCRQAIKPATASAAVQADINHNLTSAGIPNAYATITILVNGKTADALTAVKGDQVTVKVTVPVTKVGWLTPIFFSGQSVESEIVIMMRQG